jgi:hypothetical protein
MQAHTPPSAFSAGEVLAATVVTVALAGCIARIGDPSGGPAGSTPPSYLTTGAEATLLPPRIRLLSRVEYDNTVAALLGDDTHPADAFPTDEPQSEYTNNAARVSGSLLTTLYVSTAETLAASAIKNNAASLVPCDVSTGTDDCARTFIASFGKKAFRRPLAAADTDALFTVYQTASTNGGSFTDGIESVIAAMLMAPSFLYTTELGDGSAATDTVSLTPYEVAAAIAYLVTAAPPDDQLTAAADQDALGSPQAIESHVRRLLDTPLGSAQVARFVSEWIESSLMDTKDPTLYPSFAALLPSVQAETINFVDDLMSSGQGTLSNLLTAKYTVVDQPLAQLYALDVSIPAGTTQKISLDGTPRMGILMQSSFLSTHGDTQLSSPIKRGVFLRRRLLCESLPDPPVGIMANPPMPDHTKTTRVLFDTHITNPVCKSCHIQIDPIGNGFENFDTVGAYRTTDNGFPVDASGDISGTADANGHFDDAIGMIGRFAQSGEVRACFARNLFRFGSAQTSDGTEQYFLNVLGADIPESIEDLLVAYATSQLFTTRKVAR